MKQAVILAGGKGTRLSSRLNGLPKPLMDFSGNPLLWHQLNLLQKNGFLEVLVLVSHLADKIADYIEHNNCWDMDIRCIEEIEPLGTAGAVLSIYDELDSIFLVVYGDTMLDVDLAQFEAFHKNQKECGITLFVHPNSHPYDSDLIQIDNNNNVIAIHGYPHNQDLYLRNLVNAALYIINRDCLRQSSWSTSDSLDFAKDLFPQLIELDIPIAAYNSPEYIKDCGTPDRLDKAVSDYRTGKINASRLDVSQKVIFLDRDGTINYDVGHLSNEKDLRLLDGTAEAIKLINDSGYRCIIITNQPVIARGECSFAGLEKLHNIIEMSLGAEGAYIDRIYFCPHHPDAGFENERPDLKINCECRKPGIGLLKKANDDFNIDFTRSWFVGDTTVDIMTAQNLGISSILVQTGAAGMDGKYVVEADHETQDLLSAVKLILAKET
ncbi:HAD-IIIA family hydrolase [Amylibacter sp.]|nr:HAD-IIIA family hydrolase [Amylibacter sp.]